MISAVVFDMDGVLVDTEPLHFATTNAVLERHGVQLAFDDYTPYIGMGEREFFEALRERFGFDDDPARLVRERVAVSLERMAREPLPPREGALEAVLAFSGHGLRLGLASSATRAQIELVVTRLGLQRTLAVRVGAEDVEHAKPAPDLFLEAARRLEVPAAECVVVEDAVLGVRAARAAGMRVVAYPAAGVDGEAHREAGACRVLRSLAQLRPEDLDELSAPD